MDREQKFVALCKKAAESFHDLGSQGVELAVFPGWTPEATPEEDDEAIRGCIRTFAAERGIEDISADVIRIFTLLARFCLSEYRRGAKKAPDEAATSTRAGA